MTDRTDAQDNEPDDLIDLVTQEHARSILTAASEDPRTAQELADECGVSLPTIYRQVDVLESHGFLDESLRVNQSGDHRKEFETMLERVCLTFDGGAFGANVHLRRDFVDKFSALWRDLEQSGREFGW